VKIYQYVARIWTKCNSLLFWPTLYFVILTCTVFIVVKDETDGRTNEHDIRTHKVASTTGKTRETLHAVAGRNTFCYFTNLAFFFIFLFFVFISFILTLTFKENCLDAFSNSYGPTRCMLCQNLDT